jgi:hypothetical protein
MIIAQNLNLPGSQVASPANPRNVRIVPFRCERAYKQNSCDWSKLAFDVAEKLPDSIRNVLYFQSSRPMMQFLETLAGIEGVISDPYFVGGGLHQIKPGKVGHDRTDQVCGLAHPVEDLHCVHDLAGGEVGVSHRRRNRGVTCGLLDYLEVHFGLNESAAKSVPIIVLDTGIL